MQKILCLLLLPLLCCCTTDTDSTSGPVIAVADTVTYYEKSGDTVANPANPYDLAGRLHHDILEAYLPLETGNCSIPEIIKRLENAAASNGTFLAVQADGYDTPSATRLQYLMNHPLLGQAEIVNTSGLTAAARKNLSDFITQVLELRKQQQPFNAIYDAVTAYESAVLSDTNFTTFDKKILLSNAAITRYGFYFAGKHKKRKPLDRDWDHWITAIIAGIEGSTQSTANAVMLSAAASALHNN